MQSKRIIIIDGYSFVFRAYYSMPALSRQSDGMPIGAVYGFTSMIMKLLLDMKPNHIVVVFDSGEKNYRHTIYPAYKANRQPAPEDLIPQFPLMREVVKAFNIVALEQKGYEADDIIATIAHKARETEEEVLIVSADKDLMQLVNHHTKMYDAIKAKELGEPEVYEKYGVKPEQIRDLLSLVGDTSDNVPGVPGIGFKTAAELLNTFGSIEGIYANIDSIRQPKRRETLLASEDLVKVSQSLISLSNDVPLPVTLDDLKITSIDAKRLLEFLHQQGFKSLITRAQHGFGVKESNTDAQFDSNKFTLIYNEKDLKTLADKAEYYGKIAFYFQTNFNTNEDVISVNDVHSIGVMITSDYAYYIPISENITFKAFIEHLAPVLHDASILKIVYDHKRFLHLIEDTVTDITSVDDVMMMSYDLGSGRDNTSFIKLVEFYCGETEAILGGGITKARERFNALSDIEKAVYVVHKTYLIHSLHNSLQRSLFECHQQNFYQTIDRPLSLVVYKMEHRGFKVDHNILTKFSDELEYKLKELSSEIYTCAGTEFNIASPKQLSEVLFTRMSITSPNRSQSTSAEVLEELQIQGHTIADLLLEWRKLYKLKTTYTSSLVEQINSQTGRIHTSFSLALTSTGRFSSTRPNLQNIPMRGEWADRIRSAFVAKEGYKILSADYSQIELRLLAEVADIKELKLAFSSNQDIHAITASEVFGVPLNEVTNEVRNRAKAINFGIIYGISSHGLARNLGIPQSVAGEYIKRYLEKYRGVAGYMETAKKFALANGYVQTITGRRCYVNGINSKDYNERSFAERAAINFPLQGSCADIVRKAMVQVDNRLENEGIDCKLILQVHDELIFEVKTDHIDRSKHLIKRSMENIIPLSVPIIISFSEGESWNDS